MLSWIIRKQFLEYILGQRFAVAIVLCLIVGIGATTVRTAKYAEDLTTYRMNRIDHSKEAKGYTHPFPLTYSGISLDKRPQLLGIFYRGLEPSRPLTIRMTANRDPRTEDQYERGNILGELFQSIDMISFSALVLSLLALVFSYDLVSGEKERGTLRVTASFPVSRDTFRSRFH